LTGAVERDLTAAGAGDDGSREVGESFFGEEITLATAEGVDGLKLGGDEEG